MTITPVADLHCHTVASTHAYSTVAELAQAASGQGLCAVACTDHGPAMQDAPHIWHFANLHILPRVMSGVRVLQGIEANVMDGGRLDIDNELAGKLEVVVASMHGGIMPDGDEERTTAAWLAVAENPHVDIIGHSGQPAFAFDYERVIPAFGRGGKAVEINEASFTVRSASIPNCRRIAALCKKHGVRVSLDSDSHCAAQVGRTPRGLRLLEELDFPPELIINSSPERLAAFFRERGIEL